VTAKAIENMQTAAGSSILSVILDIFTFLFFFTKQLVV